MPVYTKTEFFDPKAELEELMKKEFEDDLEAQIELAAFQQMCNASGYRGRYFARVEGNRIVAC